MDRLKHYGCFDGDSSSPWGTNINAGVAQNLDRAQINEICGGNLEGIKPGV